jgi:hypothetical protein
MRDIDRALADILAIRHQLAAGTAFRGYGPVTVAITGLLALATAFAQSFWLEDATSQPVTFLAGWTGTAFVSTLLIGIEMRARSRRHHSGLADEMLQQAVEQFLPTGVAGFLLAVLLLKFAPDTLWTLPGLWQILMGLGVFASVRSLPRSIAFGGAWYFVAGFVTLVLASDSHVLSPWTMGLPFAIGQFLIAGLLHIASGEFDAED